MRKKGSALQAQYHRVKRHRGHKKAVVAVGHQILEVAFYLMRDGVTYREFGADYFDRRHAERPFAVMSDNSRLWGHVTIEKAA
jgi:transposase